MASRVASPLADGESMLVPRRLPKVRVPFDLRINGRLNSNVSLRDSWKHKLLAMPPALREQVRQTSLKRSSIEKVSKGLKAEKAKYRKLSAVFLARPENTWCICCTLRRERLGENILRNQATEIHHWAGRIGRLLCYVPFFRAFCNACRSWPHDHPSKARKLNLLAPAQLWNVFPD